MKKVALDRIDDMGLAQSSGVAALYYWFEGRSVYLSLALAIGDVVDVRVRGRAQPQLSMHTATEDARALVGLIPHASKKAKMM